MYLNTQSLIDGMFRKLGTLQYCGFTLGNTSLEMTLRSPCLTPLHIHSFGFAFAFEHVIPQCPSPAFGYHALDVARHGFLCSI